MHRITKLYSLLLAGMLLATGVSVTGCANMNSTGKGATVGAGAGAVIGGVIGRTQGNTAKGAIIGAAVGGATGAVIGRQMDKQAEELEEELANAQVERVGEGIQVTFDNAILFDFNKSALKSQARTDLGELANSLQRYDNTDVVIYGHTDSVGSDAYNMTLSEERAQAAAQFLMSQGIARSRITTIGKGEMAPVASNDTDAGRALNRRVEIAIFANEEFRQQAAQTDGR